MLQRKNITSELSLLPVLQIRSLTKKYGSAPAVRDVSFEVARGSLVSLLGPSGSGKTTILRLIAGFLTPDVGDVVLDGKRMNDLPPYRRNLTTVFQNYALFPHLNVFENVAFGLRCRGRFDDQEIRKKVGSILELVQLNGKEERSIRNLSGGEQQRVALARSVVTEPALLLLDEPLGALDLKFRREMASELRKLHQRLGITFLYITHDQEEALSISDQIIVLHQGSIKEMATPSELYAKPKTAFTADFIGGANLLSGELISQSPDLIQLRSEQGPIIRVALDRRAVLLSNKVWIAVRPEKIVVGEAAERLTNCLIGTVDDFRFYGAVAEIRVKTREGIALRARTNAIEPRDLQADQELKVGWDPVDAIIVEPDETVCSG